MDTIDLYNALVDVQRTLDDIALRLGLLLGVAIVAVFLLGLIAASLRGR